MINILSALAIHGIFYLIYFIVKLSMSKIDSYESSMKLPKFSMDKILLPILLFASIIIQFFINSKNLVEYCGNNNSNTPIAMAFTSFFLILGGIMILLKLYPGWKAPFSNTFGYLLAPLMVGESSQNITFEVSDLLKKKSSNNNEDLKMIDKLTTDNSLLINDISPEIFDKYVDTLKFPQNSNTILGKLYNIIFAKDLLSTAIWYGLAITFAVVLNMNAVYNEQCQRNEEKLQKIMREIEEENKN